MEEHYEHDAREYKGVRPRDLDEALSGDIRKAIDGLAGTSHALENIKKKTVGVWVVAAALISITFEFGVWVTNYNRNAADGSPALVKLDQKLTKQISEGLTDLSGKITAISSKDDARYDKLNEILIRVSTIQEQQSQRLDRVETRAPR